MVASTRSSGSTRSGDSPDFPALLELGRRLVEELGMDSSVDTLGRWMAHYIAQLMTEAESASPAERSDAEKRCAAAIRELWYHRHSAPHGPRHFEPQAILRAVESLDPDATVHRYFAQIREAADGEDEKVRRWLRLADGIDDTARMLIVQCLVAAAAEARDTSRPWLALAEAARLEDDAPAIAFRFLNRQHDFLTLPDPTAVRRAQLTERRDRLKMFISLSRRLLRVFEAQLEADDKEAVRSTRSLQAPASRKRTGTKARKDGPASRPRKRKKG
jgi:hypothetical protein